MLFAIHTLKKQYQNKKIYIWNINRDSIGVFTRALLRKIDIQGFVTSQPEYIGDIYMNRPILTLGQIEESDSIILVADEVSRVVKDTLPKDKAIYWTDAIEICRRLICSRNIIYGIGHGEEQLDKVLKDEGIEAELFCVTGGEKNHPEVYKGKPVIEASELCQYTNYRVIVSVLKPQHIAEILDELSNFKGEVYIELEDILDKAETMVNFIQNVELAIKKHRKIYLYSKKNIFSKLIEESLALYGVEIKGYIYDQQNEEGMENIYEIAYKDGVDDTLIIINEIIPQNLSKAREIVELAGFSLEEGNYTSIQWYAYSEKWMFSELREYPDVLCGQSIIYHQNKPGWKVYGREAEDGIRILVVGGSTSSEVYHPENWVSKLYYKLRRLDINVTIYNGAHTCNDIVSEILRVLRDGCVLRPHIVISMSGVNNTYYKKSQNQFNEERMIWWMGNGDYCSGLKSSESLYSFWKRNVNLLKVISEFYGANFFGFLQPMNITMTHMSLREKSIFEREARIIGAKDFAQSANDADGYINLMRLFEHQDEMYFDTAHYTEKGHEIIAEKVLEAIMSTIQQQI